MKKLGSDDIADIALEIVEKMVLEGLIPNCIDTDDSTEFDVQDIIRETIVQKLYLLHPHLINLEDSDIIDLFE
tara:strand:- start:318 stop:536 length:219 start_codon:yes stop_codon:yes gene_type:complete